MWVKLSIIKFVGAIGQKFLIEFILCKIASLDKYIIKYYFSVDLDKLCRWDLLGDVKELGYDISKNVKLFYVDDEDVLKIICDDETIVGLTKQLMIAKKVKVYVETSNVDHHNRLPEALIADCDSFWILGLKLWNSSKMC